MAQELKFNLKPNINDALMHYPEASTSYMTIDSQVCFHRQLIFNTHDIAWVIKAISKTSTARQLALKQ